METWMPENWTGRLGEVVRYLENAGYVAELLNVDEMHGTVKIDRQSYRLTAEGVVATSVYGFETTFGTRGRTRRFASGNPASIGSALVGDLQLRVSNSKAWDRRRTFEKSSVNPVEKELMQLCDGIRGISEGDVSVSGTSRVVDGKRVAAFTLNVDLTLSADKIRAVLALLTQLNADMPAQVRESDEDVAS